MGASSLDVPLFDEEPLAEVVGITTAVVLLEVVGMTAAFVLLEVVGMTTALVLFELVVEPLEEFDEDWETALLTTAGAVAELCAVLFESPLSSQAESTSRAAAMSDATESCFGEICIIENAPVFRMR
jgi:hypothetical protein